MKQYLAAVYLRLSRNDRDAADGTEKAESNSIGNQRALIRAFIQEQRDIEIYDSYVDDGFSGSNFDRPEFKRMMGDIEAGRVNCVIVKDLSRFGRDYIEAGKYIQKIFPLLSVRFIALTDHYDSMQADISESNIVLPVKNFINDSYCRDISVKVKSQLDAKRKSGECTASFAPYGYRKAENDKSRLVPDEYAAAVVRGIFAWRIEGMAVFAIAEKLNGLGILSPKEYKRSTGVNYRGGFSGAGRARWSSSTVKRILTDEVYLGHMVQGKKEKINYKLKKNIDKPREEWIKVENTHQAIISEEQFRMVGNLLRADGRISPVTEENSLFAGILFCGDCGEQMIRRLNRNKGSRRVYYICSTKNRGEGCSRHSTEKEILEAVVGEAIGRYTGYFMERKKLLEQARETGNGFVGGSMRRDGDLARLKREQERYDMLCSCLHEDVKQGVITEEEGKRLYDEFRRRSAEMEEAQKKQEEMIKTQRKNCAISAARLQHLQERMEISAPDRYTLCSMVKRISVFENRRLEIEFAYVNPYRTT